MAWFQSEYMEKRLRQDAAGPSMVFRLCLLGVLSTTPLIAYFDPNTTGIVTQILGPALAIVAAGLTFLRKQIGTAIRRVVGLRDTPK